MLPKVSLFHLFRWPLRNISFFWNWYIFAPSGGMNEAQVVLTNSLKVGWVSQNPSNLKGLLIMLPGLCHWREIGQWSESENGRIDAQMSPPRCTALSEMRNLSSLEAIWCRPTLRLLQDYIPLQNCRSISILFWIKSLKWPFSCSSLPRPPCFSSSLVIMLKYPPMIQSGWSLLKLSASIVSKRAILLLASCGK